MKFVSEVWYGQRSLAQTFWLWYGLFVGLFIGGGGAVIAMMFALTTASMFPVYLIGALSLPINVWILVGLWRSATNNPGFWAVVVKISVVLGIIGLIVNWAQIFSGKPSISIFVQ